MMACDVLPVAMFTFVIFSEHGVNISKEEVALYFSSKVCYIYGIAFTDSQPRMGNICDLSAAVYMA